MNILVFSDSHGETGTMFTAVETYCPEAVIHLGDYVSDARALASRFGDIPLHSVAGNGDFLSKTVDEAVFEIKGHKLFCTHGHRYYVKNGYQNVRRAGAKAGADIVLFGHTHIPCSLKLPGLILANPGSAGGRDPTFGMLSLDDRRAQFQIMRL